MSIKSFKNIPVVVLLMLVVAGAIFYRSEVFFKDLTALTKNLKATYAEAKSQQDLMLEIKNLEALLADPKLGKQTVGIRDFFQYKCQKQLRIGGPENYVKKAPDPLYRIDGAWFVCADSNLLVEGNCTVLSFGVNTDPSFDIEMLKKYKCRVDSFDPFIEASVFSDLRAKDPSLKTSMSLRVQPGWSFHRIGIVGYEKDATNLNRIGAMGTLNQILDYTKLKNKV